MVFQQFATKVAIGFSSQLKNFFKSLLKRHCLTLKTIIRPFYWCLKHDHSWSTWSISTDVFLKVFLEKINLEYVHKGLIKLIFYITIYPAKEASVRDHPLSTYTKFSEKLIFLIPDTHTYLCVSGGKKC